MTFELIVFSVFRRVIFSECIVICYFFVADKSKVFFFVFVKNQNILPRVKSADGIICMTDFVSPCSTGSVRFFHSKIE